MLESGSRYTFNFCRYNWLTTVALLQNFPNAYILSNSKFSFIYTQVFRQKYKTDLQTINWKQVSSSNPIMFGSMSCYTIIQSYLSQLNTRTFNRTLYMITVQNRRYLAASEKQMCVIIIAIHLLP